MVEWIVLEEDLFSTALILPAAERACYLHRACGSNQDLRLRVEGLLADADAAAAFADRQLWRAAGSAAPVSQCADREFGAYRLLQIIGEGGCGEVFLAEQERPVRRQVALKIIKLGMDTKAVIGRFNAEQQALALMDHPNIARVFEVGATPTGRPYFAMELVRGIKITKYCDQARLSIAERLELFTQVCRAIQHAHHKGVVHRDIKPSNVLVTLHDSLPMAKVIDFGIAKATQGKLTDQTLYTALDQFVGTPAYVSPEQLDSTWGDVDCRSDIYSLGVLLYELVAGQTPFEAPDSPGTGVDEFRRRVRLEEPPLPSQKLRRMSTDALSAAALSRQTTASKLIEQARGDLDWIIMRCLEKRRERRYSSPDELAQDVRHFLRNEPVLARSPTVVYSLGKLARRNRLVFAAAAAVLFVLIIATIVSTSLAVRAYRAEQLARREAATQEALSSFLRNGLLAQASPDDEPDRNLTLRAALDRAAVKIQGRFTGQPLVEAAIRTTLADTYQSLGEYAAAETHFERALSLDRDELGESDRNSLYVARKLATVLTEQGQYQKAEALARKTLTLHERSLGANHPETLEAMFQLAEPLYWKGERPAARQLLLEALQDSKRTLGAAHPTTLKLMNELSIFYLADGQPAEAKKLLLQALPLRQSLSGEDHPDTIRVMNNLAGAYADLNDHAAAEPLMLKVVQLRTRVLGADHPLTLNSMNNLATLYADEGRYPESAQLDAQAIEIGQKKLGADSPDVLLWSNNLGRTYLDEDKVEAAYGVLSRTYELRRKVLGPENPDTLVSMSNLALAEHRRGRLLAAESLLTRAWAAGERVLGPDNPDHLVVGERLATVWLDQKKFAAAENLLRSIADKRREHHPDEWQTYATVAQLGRVLVAMHRYSEAEPLLVSAYQQLTLQAQGIPDDQKKLLHDTSVQILKLRARGKSPQGRAGRAKRSQ